MTTTQQKTRYFEVLPHKAGPYESGYETGDYFSVQHIGKVLAQSSKGGTAGIFRAGRPVVRLVTSDYPGGLNDGPVFPLDVLQEVGEFFKGEEVWIRQGAQTVTGQILANPTSGTVAMSEGPYEPRRLVSTPGGRWYSVKVEDLSRTRPAGGYDAAGRPNSDITKILRNALNGVSFEVSNRAARFTPAPRPVASKAALRFEDIEAGDKVTFRLTQTGEEYTTTAYLEDGDTVFMGWATDSVDASDGLTLLRIEKPEPLKQELPTAIGSVIQFKANETTRVSTLVSPGRWKVLLEDGKPGYGANSAGMLEASRIYSDFVTLYDAGSDS